MINVFIDGSAGTTGLRIREMLMRRGDVALMELPEHLRKDAAARKDALYAADVAFLCLPDDAAREAAQLAQGADTVLIDASTAHRTNPQWAYGFPELSAAHRRAVESSRRIANPGCYASGFAALVYPLTSAGILPPDYPIVCHAVSGYSGAGKKGIAQYEASERSAELETPRLYALTQQHKHLAEMKAVCALTRTPVFDPYICDFRCGMTVTVPLFADLLKTRMNVASLEEFYRAHYAGQRFIRVAHAEDGFIPANTLNGTNMLEIFVCGNEERLVLTARLDNLGKGASGAAIENMNLALGLDESLGL